ncbi:hypothetical protein LIER_07843 [Lithospermum erythrorhizon]|uniref:Uncharacterized protein n=1 Tax=Lithospermum erythrorhizon TaxID=34254 RepID=A0AAV3PAP8_LITER
MFSRIGSYVGNSLFVDGATSDLARVSYAQIYVEIAAGKELPITPLKQKKVWMPKVDEGGTNEIQQALENIVNDEPEKDSIVDGITEHESPRPIVEVRVDNPLAVLDDEGK